MRPHDDDYGHRAHGPSSVAQLCLLQGLRHHRRALHGLRKPRLPRGQAPPPPSRAPAAARPTQPHGHAGLPPRGLRRGRGLPAGGGPRRRGRLAHAGSVRGFGTGRLPLMWPLPRSGAPVGRLLLRGASRRVGPVAADSGTLGLRRAEAAGSPVGGEAVCSGGVHRRAACT